MRIAVFAAKPYDRAFLGDANAAHGHDLAFFEARLDAATVPLAAGAPAVCVFVNDRVDAAVLERLAAGGTRLVALRCAGFNNVDLHAAARLGIAVVRVPAYSPRAVAEFTVGLLLAVERRIARGWARVRDDNFALDGLIGRNLHGRTAGVVGTGQIGAIVARILGAGFGCRVLAHDPVPDPALAACGVRYADWPTLAAEADVLTLHCPLTSATRHLIDADAIGRMRDGVLIVNTGRGALIDTAALIDGLKSRRVGGVALDVYEQEADLFFEDLSSQIVQDDVFQRLLTFPNVIVTGHQAFLTAEALGEIARTTLASVAAFEAGGPLAHRIEAAAAPAAGGAERPDTPDTPDTQSPAAPAAPAAHAEPAMPAAVRDWHAHVYYDPATTRDAAARLRDEVDARFAVQIGRWHDVPVGPHTAAMYQVAFDVAEFPAFVPWLALHRAGLSVLVHPNTLAPRDDHLRHALWLGTPLPLKGDVLPETSTDAEEPPVTPNTAAARAAGR